MRLEDRLKPAPRAVYFVAIATGTEAYHTEAQECLSAELGPFGQPSPLYNFSDFSTYYDAELGGSCWKYLLALREPRPPEEIIDIKLATERVQKEFVRSSPEGPRRTVNVDPGYVNGWQVTLATVKNQAHRIYLGRGVFLEVELLFRHGAFEPLPWTYPDYRTEPVLGFLREARAAYFSAAKRPKH